MSGAIALADERLDDVGDFEPVVRVLPAGMVALEGGEPVQRRPAHPALLGRPGSRIRSSEAAPNRDETAPRRPGGPQGSPPLGGRSRGPRHAVSGVGHRFLALRRVSPDGESARDLCSAAPRRSSRRHRRKSTSDACEVLATAPRAASCCTWLRRRSMRASSSFISSTTPDRAVADSRRSGARVCP